MNEENKRMNHMMVVARDELPKNMLERLPLEASKLEIAEELVKLARTDPHANHLVSILVNVLRHQAMELGLLE